MTPLVSIGLPRRVVVGVRHDHGDRQGARASRRPRVRGHQRHGEDRLGFAVHGRSEAQKHVDRILAQVVAEHRHIEHVTRRNQLVRQATVSPGVRVGGGRQLARRARRRRLRQAQLERRRRERRIVIVDVVDSDENVDVTDQVDWRHANPQRDDAVLAYVLVCRINTYILM